MPEMELYTKQNGSWVRFGMVDEISFQVDNHKVDIVAHSLSGYTVTPDRNTEIKIKTI